MSIAKAQHAHCVLGSKTGIQDHWCLLSTNDSDIGIGKTLLQFTSVFRSDHMITLGLEYIMARASRTEHGSKVSDDFFWLFICEEVTSAFLLALENNWAESSSPGPGNDSELLWRRPSASCAGYGLVNTVGTHPINARRLDCVSLACHHEPTSGRTVNTQAGMAGF